MGLGGRRRIVRDDQDSERRKQVTTTRCKFTCQSVTKLRHWDKQKGFLYEAEFQAVHDGSDENKEFFDATPSGLLKVGTYKEDVFEPGKDYFIDISEA